MEEVKAEVDDAHINYDALINIKQRQLDGLCAEMEKCCSEFIKQTVKFATNWYEETAKNYVTKYPEITLSLGKTRVIEMKNKVNSLSSNAEAVVTAALSLPGVWWHKKPRLHDKSSLYEQFGNAQVGTKFPEVIDKPVRYALGELGRVLQSYGFNVTADEAFKGAYPEFWFEYLNGSEGKTRPYFPHLLEWSLEMQDALANYSLLYQKASALFNEICLMKDEERKKEASDLWDSS